MDFSAAIDHQGALSVSITPLPASRIVYEKWFYRCFLIGNDIVDLLYFDTPLYRHVRYISRLCSPSEARALRQSADGNRDLAILWSAKEAAYKLLANQLGLRHFVPREFVTNFAGFETTANRVSLETAYGEAQAHVDVHVHERWVHAIARFERRCAFDWRVEEISGWQSGGVTPDEESESVRELAAKLIAEHGWDGVSIDSKNGIPRLKQAVDSGLRIDVSLSHHGYFVAAAIAWSAEDIHRRPDMERDVIVGAQLGEACSICMA